MADDFVKKMTIAGRVILIDGLSADVPCASLQSAAWLPDGVALDWATLHAKLQRSPPIHENEFKALAEAFNADGARLCTSIELLDVVEKLPLTPEASALCNFSHDGKWYRFKRGPPGQRSIADTATALLASVCSQLREQRVQAFPLMSSVVIFSSTFDEALHRTAQVHKVLKSAGLNIFAAGSCFVPRSIVPEWGTLELGALGDLAGEFVAFAYAMLIHDSHLWAALPYSHASIKNQSREVTLRDYVEIVAPHLKSDVDGLISNAQHNLVKPGIPQSEKFSHFEARWFNHRSGFNFL